MSPYETSQVSGEIGLFKKNKKIQKRLIVSDRSKERLVNRYQYKDSYMQSQQRSLALNILKNHPSVKKISREPSPKGPMLKKDSHGKSYG